MSLLLQVLNGIKPKPDRCKAHPTVCSAPTWQVLHYSHCTVYTGTFTVYRPGGKPIFQIPGKVVVQHGLGSDVYLFNPPAELRALPAGSCLQLVSPDSGWFKLHWARPALDFDNSRAFVEDMIAQLFSKKIMC